MSDTPRTDAVFSECFGCEFEDYTPNQKRAITFARTLERELNESIKVNAELLERLRERCADYTTHAARELDKLRKVQKELESAKVAFGEHPESEFDLAERICKLRDEHRNDFHVHTENIRLKELLVEARADAERLANVLRSIDLSPCNGGSCMVATDADDFIHAAIAQHEALQ